MDNVHHVFEINTQQISPTLCFQKGIMSHPWSFFRLRFSRVKESDNDTEYIDKKWSNSNKALGAYNVNNTGTGEKLISAERVEGEFTMVSQPKRKNVYYSSDIISIINNGLVIFRGMGSIFNVDINIIALANVISFNGSLHPFLGFRSILRRVIQIIFFFSNQFGRF